MTNDKTTALIDKIEGLKEQVYYVDGKPSIAPFADVVNDKLDAAIHIISGAFEQPAVREVSVDEVANIIYGVERWCTLYHAELAAKALAKLGTIKVVES